MAETRSGRWRGLLFTLLLMAAATVAVWYLWQHYFEDIWTRDARVRAVVIKVAPDVSGAIIGMAVNDNQYVAQGDPLFTVDKQRYQLAVEQARASLTHSRDQLVLREHEARRRKHLGNEVSAEEREQAISAAALAKADHRAAEVALANAELDLARTDVIAPVSGYVTHLLAHRGDYAHAGSPVLTLVDGRSFWVEAYLKETQVHRIKNGDRVRVRLLGTDQDLSGRVDGIARGIGNSNAVASDDQGLPSVAPTFEWVRLAQRIPVHITLEKIPEGLMLSAGMTASVRVYPGSGEDTGSPTGSGVPATVSRDTP